MSSIATLQGISDVETTMQAQLETQRADFMQEGVVSAAVRIDRLDRGIDALVRYADKVAEACLLYTSPSPRDS